VAGFLLGAGAVQFKRGEFRVCGSSFKRGEFKMC